MGGVILVSILVTTVLLYYVSILDNDKRKASYEIQSAQTDMNKAAENLKVFRDQDLVVIAPNSYINTFMSNDGSLPLIITHTLLYCLDTGCPTPNDPVVSETPLTLNGKEQANTPVGPVSNGLTYRVDFITERGNVVSTPECDVDLTQGICTNDPGTGGIPNFILSASPSTLVLDHGTSGGTTVTVTSLNDFADPVQIDVSGVPSDITVSPLSNTVTPPAGGSVDYPLTITASSSAAPGTYNLTLTGTSTSITHTTRISVTIIKIPTLEELKEDDSLLKPQIQGVFPNPYGELASNSAKTGLWGVVVANPSDAPMTISRVVVTAFLPYGNNPTVFPNNIGPSGCNVDTTQVPSVGGNWSCPARNVLAWSGSYTIPARSAQEFLVKVGRPSSNENFPSYAVNFNVFTTFGQYAKAGYSGSMTSSPSEIANVYLSTSTGSMIGKLSGISDGTILGRATIANFGDTGVIKQGTKLILSIPKAFDNVNVVPNPPPGFQPCTITKFLDNSHQISCPLSSDLTSGQTRTIEFSMTAPLVTEIKLYPMLVLADGTDGNAAPMGAVGPVAENVIVVTP
jgi:hypothetical protein